MTEETAIAAALKRAEQTKPKPPRFGEPHPAPPAPAPSGANLDAPNMDHGVLG